MYFDRIVIGYASSLRVSQDKKENGKYEKR